MTDLRSRIAEDQEARRIAAGPDGRGCARGVESREGVYVAPREVAIDSGSPEAEEWPDDEGQASDEETAAGEGLGVDPFTTDRVARLEAVFMRSLSRVQQELTLRVDALDRRLAQLDRELSGLRTQVTSGGSSETLARLGERVGYMVSDLEAVKSAVIQLQTGRTFGQPFMPVANRERR